MKIGYWIATITLVAIIVIGAKVLMMTNTPEKLVALPAITEAITPAPTIIPVTQALTSTTSTSNQKGTIEGSLSYPSEMLPENMEVCAENVEAQQTICTTEKIKDKKYTYGTGYKLQVPAGNYFVYARIPKNDYTAYYDEFVTCGLQASCPSHKPIEIEVKANQTTSKVDPQDWYNIEPSL